MIIWKNIFNIFNVPSTSNYYCINYCRTNTFGWLWLPAVEPKSCHGQTVNFHVISHIFSTSFRDVRTSEKKRKQSKQRSDAASRRRQQTQTSCAPDRSGIAATSPGHLPCVAAMRPHVGDRQVLRYLLLGNVTQKTSGTKGTQASRMNWDSSRERRKRSETTMRRTKQIVWSLVGSSTGASRWRGLHPRPAWTADRQQWARHLGQTENRHDPQLNRFIRNPYVIICR